jgi:hypothetical protein
MQTLARERKPQSHKSTAKKWAISGMLAFLGGYLWLKYGMDYPEPFATIPKGGPSSHYLGPCGKKGFDCGYVMYVAVDSFLPFSFTKKSQCSQRLFQFECRKCENRHCYSPSTKAAIEGQYHDQSRHVLQTTLLHNVLIQSPRWTWRLWSCYCHVWR